MLRKFVSMAFATAVLLIAVAIFVKSIDIEIGSPDTSGVEAFFGSIFSLLGKWILPIAIVGLAILLFRIGGTPGKVAGAILILLVVLLGSNFSRFTDVFYASVGDMVEGRKPLITIGSQPAAPTKITTSLKARWNKLKSDGTIPVSVWSEPSTVPLGCAVDLPSGIPGSKVRYKFYSKDWIPYIFGTSPNMEVWQVMMTEEGVTHFPYSVTCPNRK